MLAMLFYTEKKWAIGFRPFKKKELYQPYSCYIFMKVLLQYFCGMCSLNGGNVSMF